MGTDAWQNWNAFNEGLSESENADDELYSDRHFVGGPSTHGPYTLTTIIGSGLPSAVPAVRPAVRLHTRVHANLIPEIVIDGALAPTDSAAYHGGTAGDEVAALASLELGVRLRVAGTSQFSGIHRDGEEHSPIYLEVAPLAHPGRPGCEYVPAATSRPADLGQLSRLDSFPSMEETAQIELVRAARAYATGLWWSNEDQNQAWLKLVTAVEIAANHRQQVRTAPESLVQALWPELWTALTTAGDTARAQVALLVAPQIRATRKFVDFLVACAPKPPALRPPHGKLEWGDMAQHARLIYGHRGV